MNTLARYTASDLPALLDKISKNSIGMNEYLNRVFDLHETTTNYPPYNIVKLNAISQQLQIALAGFRKEDIEVAIEKKVLTVRVSHSYETEGEYIHKGIAQRSFSRNWQLSNDTEIEDVTYIDGLLRITLTKNVPEEERRRVIDIS